MLLLCQLNGEGREYAVDVWAYIVMRKEVHERRQRFGVHPLDHHAEVAKELYQSWGEEAPGWTTIWHARA